jgi:hypothetical protein
MRRFGLLTLSAIVFSSCTTYRNLLIFEDYSGDRIRVQSHADPCCGWAGLRFIYNEGNKTEHVIYYYWFDTPYAEKEVRTLDHKKVIHSEKFQLVFDTARYREPLIEETIRYGDTTRYDINDQLLSTKWVKPVIPLNHIDSILLFHAPHLLTNVDRSKIWLLDKAAGYVKGGRQFSYNHNGSKKIK